MLNITKIPPWLDAEIASNERAVKENFADWFGPSKVLDRRGLPRVVFHGCADDFHVFDPKKIGSKHVDVESVDAFFFSNDIKTANWYAKDAGKANKATGRRSGGANVMAVYLALHNPLIIDFQETGIEYLAEEIHEAKRKGHDGLIARNYDDGGVSDHYIAFFAHQVKSAIGNSGLYLPHSGSMSDWQENQHLRHALKARTVSVNAIKKPMNSEVAQAADAFEPKRAAWSKINHQHRKAQA